MASPIVLIADDDADLRDLLARRCRALGLGVHIAEDAMTALRRIDQVRPDVAILDVNMPGGNGLSVREMMSEHEELSKVPVIMLTGRSDEETIRRCYNSCAFYVAKCPDVWPRVEPLLREILGLPSENATGSSAAPAATPKSDAYQDSDQKVFFDWVFDLLADPPASSADVQEIPQRSPETPWVLCIDDDSELTLGLQMRLHEHGVEVLRAFSGMEGYRNAFICAPRAILLDYEMPDGRGDYVLRRLKETPGTKDIPVIVLSGRKEHSIQRQMFQLGAAAYLTKPCAWESLWSVLRQYLEPVLT